MSELLFTPQLLFGLISLSLLQIISADLISVDPGENITLLCNITQYSQISWYQMNSAGMREIISARQRKIGKRFYIEYNVDESHFDVTESNRLVSLVIIGVRETDLGFYYCGGKNDATHTQFGKQIRLILTPDGNTPEPPDHEEPAGPGFLWIIILLCVCSVSVLINIICMCVFCSRNPDVCVISSDSDEKDVSLQHTADWTCVTFTQVS
ncbi:uncharacterized protein LOC128516164 [Clarias gariepinus]|uniref:uncharacterized protein LOC128516164 n=1 Tax=Clarias gariepinus TaxID=13013 RepID=UPI00234E354C|nr:uncharacterized protein LOC128516164 [Clarias gariepinus]